MDPIACRTALLASSLGVGVLAIVTVWLTAAWLFARVPGLVYSLDSAQRTALDFAHEALVTSLGVRFVIALGLASLVITWQRAGRAARAAASAP